MPSRHAGTITQPLRKRNSGLRQIDSDTDDFAASSPINTPAKTATPLSPMSVNTIRLVPTLEGATAATNKIDDSRRAMDDSLDGSDGSRITEKDNTPSPASKTYGALPTAQSTPILASIPPGNSPQLTGSTRTMNAELGSSRSYPGFPVAEDSTASNATGSPQQWSSAVGRANLGKSGRVIERLMGENDMLKRELQIEKFKGEESKQAVKMIEARMDVMATEYEGRLHEAAITKTLLKRKERLLSELKAQIDGERARASAAVDRERGWREAMEKMEVETKKKVDEATNYALLMEGRNKTLTNHWKEQGQMVNTTVSKLNVEISALVSDRISDCERIDSLEVLYNQKTDALIRLEAEKRRMADLFEAYRGEQEPLLDNIKARARQQEQMHEKVLAETQAVLKDLKWALGVKESTKDA